MQLSTPVGGGMHRGFKRRLSHIRGKKNAWLLPLLLGTAALLSLCLLARQTPRTVASVHFPGAASTDYNQSSGSSGGSSWEWLPLQQLQAAAGYLHSMSQPRTKPVVSPEKYLIPPEPLDMRSQHKKVQAHINSPAFRQAVAQREAGSPRGIIINGGGRKMLSSVVVLLKVLREVHNCTLPVELAWHHSQEMDNVTLAALAARFGPLRGYNVREVPWPTHQRQNRPPAALEANRNFLRFERKVHSLAYSSFRSALLLDSDNIPLVNPEVLWDDLEMVEHGCLFWPDFWARSERKDLLYDMVGLEYKPALEALNAGKGRLNRDTESGALLMDLVRHADVLEYLLWINSWGEMVYKAVWGDKDTYAVAFAVAGKAQHFTQVEVPPGGAFTWRPKMLLVKATRRRQDGWQLSGMVQYDNRGAPVFVHRTINKFWYAGDDWELERLTAPLPLRWVRYYLDHDSLGPTAGVPYDYVVPATALYTWQVNPPMLTATANLTSWVVKPQEQGCPVVTFLDYWRAREQGLPLGPPADPQVVPSCMPMLHAMLGPTAAAAYHAAGFDVAPELVTAHAADWDAAVVTSNATQYAPAVEVGDGTPVAAWRPEYFHPTFETQVTRVLRASHAAFAWLTANVAEFPIIQRGP